MIKECFCSQHTVCYSNNKSKVKKINFEVHNVRATAMPALHHVTIKTLMAFIKDDLASMSLASNCFL